MKKIIVLLSLLIFASPLFAVDNASASTLKIKVFQFAVSQNADCSNLTTVFSDDDGVEADVLTSPTFGQGTLADGTYPCVAIKFSDNITFVPATDNGTNCTKGTQYTLEVCQSGIPYDQIDGGTGTCAANTNFYTDNVTMWITTNSSTTGGGEGTNAFQKPTSIGASDKGLNLGTALTVSGATTGRFTVDASEKICDGDEATCGGQAGKCEMGVPLFSFSKVN